jgi:cytochrome c oxidase subunit 1
MAFIGFTYYMFPFITGRMYNERVAMVSFWLFFAGLSIVFLTQHILGLYGQPRRVFDYVPVEPLIIMNQIASVGGYLAGAGAGLFIYSLITGAFKGKPAKMDDPFAIGEQYYDYTRREPHH